MADLVGETEGRQRDAQSLYANLSREVAVHVLCTERSSGSRIDLLAASSRP